MVPLRASSSDQGYEVDVLCAADPHFKTFGRISVIGSVAAGVRRPYPKHEETWCWLYACHGAAKVVLHDDRPHSASYGAKQELFTGERCADLIIVPPGVYYGVKPLTDDTQLIHCASDLRDPQGDSEAPTDAFGEY